MRFHSIRVFASIGLILAHRVAFAQEQAPLAKPSELVVSDDRLGIRTAPILLLTRPDVCADLGLTADQRVAAETAIQGFYAEALSLNGKTGPTVATLRGQINTRQARWIQEHLSREQGVRLLQIDMQWEGASALFSRPMVSETLGLSPDQIVILKAEAKKASAERAKGGYTLEYHTLCRKTSRGILSIEQQDRWDAILGTRFVPQLANVEPKSAHSTATAKK